MNFVEWVLTAVATITVGLIKLVWTMLNERITNGDCLNKDNIDSNTKTIGEHYSRIHNNETNIVEINRIVAERTRESDRRFDEIGRRCDSILDLLKEVNAKFDHFRERRGT